MKLSTVAVLLAICCGFAIGQDRPAVNPAQPAAPAANQGPANQPPEQPANRVPAAAVRGRGGPAGGFGSGFVGPATTTAPAAAAQPEFGTRTSSGSTLSRMAPSTSRPLPDKIGKSLRFDVLIAELYEQNESPTVGNILDLEKAGKLTFSHRMQLATVENEPAFVQLGALTARITGRTITSMAQIPIYNDINLGTIAQITARVDEDGSILAQVYVERSALSGGPEEAFDPTSLTPPKGIDRMLTSSTVRLTPGEPQVVGGSQATQAKDSSKSWIIVTGYVGSTAAAQESPASGSTK